MKTNVQKSVLHAQFFFCFFLLIRSIGFDGLSHCRRRLALHGFIFLFMSILILVSLLALAKSIYYIEASYRLVTGTNVTGTLPSFQVN